MNDPEPGFERGYRPQDLPGYGDPENFPSTSLTPPYGPGNPPPESEGWLPVETYTDGSNLRVVALECAVACGLNATNVLTYADQFLKWLEAGE